jgi:hypothetical protein
MAMQDVTEAVSPIVQQKACYLHLRTGMASSLDVLVERAIAADLVADSPDCPD